MRQPQTGGTGEKEENKDKRISRKLQLFTTIMKREGIDICTNIYMKIPCKQKEERKKRKMMISQSHWENRASEANPFRRKKN